MLWALFLALSLVFASAFNAAAGCVEGGIKGAPFGSIHEEKWWLGDCLRKKQRVRRAASGSGQFPALLPLFGAASPMERLQGPINPFVSVLKYPTTFLFDFALVHHLHTPFPHRPSFCGWKKGGYRFPFMDISFNAAALDGRG